MTEMTGSVILESGLIIYAPFGGLVGKDGLTGYWRPLDQNKHPITPVPVKLYRGEWWSVVALESYLKSLEQ